LSKWQISQKGRDILRAVGFSDPNGPSLVPSAVNLGDDNVSCVNVLGIDNATV
jgi:hypothetical protein